MRIYINNLTYDNLNLQKINEYFFKQEKNSLVYSLDSIYKIVNNKIYNLLIYDEEIETLNIKNYNFILDNSTMKLELTNSQISVPNHIIMIDTYYFRLRKLAKVNLIIEKSKNKIMNLYFTTEEKNLENLISFEDIFTFLSLFN